MSSEAPVTASNVLMCSAWSAMLLCLSRFQNRNLCGTQNLLLHTRIVLTGCYCTDVNIVGCTEASKHAFLGLRATDSSQTEQECAASRCRRHAAAAGSRASGKLSSPSSVPPCSNPILPAQTSSLETTGFACRRRGCRSARSATRRASCPAARATQGPSSTRVQQLAWHSQALSITAIRPSCHSR
jgi:hypothetical protein